MVDSDDEAQWSLPKGTRDILPEDKILKNSLLRILEDTFVKYGFEPIETPALQRMPVLMAKYGGGEEIAKEIFQVSDQANRKLGLRYEFTVGMCRLLGERKDLPRPFKRYEMGPTWRDGPIKMGRYREFWQCDVDIVGPSDMSADAEYVAIAEEIFEKLGLDIIIKVSNRKLAQGMLEFVGVDKDKIMTTMLSIDKWSKIGEKGVERELLEKEIPQKQIDDTLKLFKTEGNGIELLDKLEKKLKNEKAQEGIKELKDLLKYIEAFGVKKQNYELDITLVRGLVYYTGTTYEVYLKDQSKINCSLLGGGRYDKYVSTIMGDKEQKIIPAVGLSFGLDTIADVIKLKNKKIKKTVVNLFVIPLIPLEKVIEIVTKFRKAGINTDLDFMNRGLSKNLNYINSQNIPFAAIIGEKEAKDNKITLRNMDSGEQKLLSVEEVIKILIA